MIRGKDNIYYGYIYMIYMIGVRTIYTMIRGKGPHRAETIGKPESVLGISTCLTLNVL